MPLITKEEAANKGIPRNSLQTIEIPREFTLKQSREFLKNNGYLYQNYRTTKNFRRFIQNPDIKDAKFYSKKLTNDIILVFQEY